jgi:hypothetical protein
VGAVHELYAGMGSGQTLVIGITVFVKPLSVLIAFCFTSEQRPNILVNLFPSAMRRYSVRCLLIAMKYLGIEIPGEFVEAINEMTIIVNTRPNIC